MRYILEIEFEYANVYLNSLALHAVVERCTHNFLSRNPTDKLDVKDSGPIPAATLLKWLGEDRVYIVQVVEGCRKVLRLVADALPSDGSLRHVPVRTFFRIISVSIILLKVCLSQSVI